MPRQLLQLLRSPFFGTLTSILLLQSLGAPSVCHILLYIEVRFSIPKLPSALNGHLTFKWSLKILIVSAICGINYKTYILVQILFQLQIIKACCDEKVQVEN